MATDYTADQTYWTGRKRGAQLEVVLMERNASGGYDAARSYGYYERHGAAVAAAAQLAYFQGKRDAQVELSARVHEALESVDLGPVVLDAPDESEGGDEVALPEPTASDAGGHELYFFFTVENIRTKKTITISAESAEEAMQMVLVSPHRLARSIENLQIAEPEDK